MPYRSISTVLGLQRGQYAVPFATNSNVTRRRTFPDRLATLRSMRICGRAPKVRERWNRWNSNRLPGRNRATRRNAY